MVKKPEPLRFALFTPTGDTVLDICNHQCSFRGFTSLVAECSGDHPRLFLGVQDRATGDWLPDLSQWVVS